MQPAYFCDAIRTPFGRYGGGLAAVRADDLAAISIRALIGRNPGADWLRLDDVFYGCANQSGEDNRNVARMAALLAGLNERIPATTINRLCGSSLDAASLAARSILSGEISFAIAGGVESMSRAPFVLGKADAPFTRAQKLEDTTMGWRFINPLMKQLYGTDTMPETAENVAAEFGIARTDQDFFALRSQQKAAAAIADGRMAEEIVLAGTLTADEHPRPRTTIEALEKLKPVVRPGGTVTAGNASGINDGACALLLASESAAREHGLEPKARFIASASAGVAPRVMGMGPVPATERVLAKARLTLDQIDIIELNEAFAAQGLAVLRQLRIADDDPRVNPQGGAIALGHPLGASGARLLTTAIHQLRRTGGRYALCAMCIGVGQGIAMVIERV
jgi:3-oxoadipyl-CoA thiolase